MQKYNFFIEKIKKYRKFPALVATKKKIQP